VTEAPCFRIGNIGDLHEEDMRNLIHGVEEVCAEMGIELPIKE
jgi:aspartate aminotransferase-like enzyme